MKAFVATALTVIAVGVMLIAYGLLNPRAGAADAGYVTRPIDGSNQVRLIDDGAAYTSGMTDGSVLVRQAIGGGAGTLFEMTKR